MSPVRRALAGAVLLAALLAPAAHAARVPVRGGATTLTLNTKTAKAIAGLGVGIKVTGDAKAGAGGGSVQFPIVGGKVDLANGTGTVKHIGGLKLFTKGGPYVILYDFVINSVTGKLSVAVGDARVNAFKLDASGAELTRAGAGGRLTGVDVALTKAGARALNGVFDTTAFKTATPIGTADVDLNATQYLVAGGATSLRISEGAGNALKSLGITPGVADGATLNPDGTVGFPVVGGRLTTEGLDGRVRHAGALTLTRGDVTVTLSSFDLSTAKNQLTGLVNGAGPATLVTTTNPATGTVSEDRTIAFTDITASLTGGAATALNQAFNTTAFTPGLVLGYLNTSANAL